MKKKTKKNITLFSAKPFLWQCQEVCHGLSDSSITTLVSLSPTSPNPVRAKRKQAAHLLLSPFPACCFRLGQNYLNHLEIFWVMHLQRKVWWFFPSNSFKIVYEPLLFLCSRIANVILEYNKPNLEPLRTEDMPKVTSTD